LDLALEFGISKELASDLVKDGNRQIETYRIWLRKGSQTWKNLLDLLHKIKEDKLVDELQNKLEKGGIVIL